MLKGKAKRRAKRIAKKNAKDQKVNSTKSEILPSSPLLSPPASDGTSGTAQPKPWYRKKWVIATAFSALVVFGVGYMQLRPAQEQANEAKQGNDRVAGRFQAKVHVVEFIPSRESEEMKQLDQPAFQGWHTVDEGL
jgi:hypothetical protein